MEQEMKIFHDNFEDGPSSGLLFGELSLYLGEEEELEIVWDLGYFSDILNKYDGVVYPLSEVKNFIKNYEQRAGQSYYNFFSPVTIELDGDLVIFTYEMPPEIRSKYRTRSVEFLLEDLKEFIEKHENLKKEAINANRLMVVLKEAIYGNMATVFHRTSVSDLVNKVFDSGFKPGDGAMYGSGFYSTYELESQLRANMETTYGPIIVKFACPIQTFFIFDYEEFKKSPNFKKLNSPSKNEFLKAQFEFFKMDYSKFSFKKAYYSKFTSDIALWCTKNIPNFKKLCEGIIFTGSTDGKVLVSYNTKLIMPLSYTLDEGRNWEKVELNLDYLKKVAKVKNRFIPDLIIKPEDFRINNYDFDSNGFLNVKGDVYISNENLTKLPFKFGKVEGNFWCTDNNLTSLEGSPREVERTFWCNNNNLTSLKGAPEEVWELFDCTNNNLTSLEGAPQKVGGSFYCHNNNLTSLEGAPKEVGGDFDCSDNNLTSLEEATQKVGGYFRCANNNLTSLEGAPQKVGGNFYCHNNNLTSLEGAPQKVGGNFNCKNNKTKFKVKDVRKVCNVKGEIIV